MTASTVWHLTPPILVPPYLAVSLGLKSSKFCGPLLPPSHTPVWAAEAADLTLHPASFCHLIRVEAMELPQTLVASSVKWG